MRVKLKTGLLKIVTKGGRIVTTATEATPDAFSFAAQTDVARSAPITSAPVTPVGYSAPTTVTVSGGEVSINYGAFGSGGLVNPGETLRARLTSSASYSTPAACTVTAGGVSATFTATTVAEAGVAVPAAVASPVQGTALTAVWNQRFGGVGPLNSPSNGTWSGALNSYLIALGFVIGNDGALYLNVGSGSKTISRFDFTNSPAIHLNGTGSVTLVDCVEPKLGIAYPVDINGNLNFTTGVISVTHTNCLLDETVAFLGAGSHTFNDCRGKNQADIIWGTAFNASASARTTLNGGYWTGGGCGPSPGQHVELIQSIQDAGGSVGSSFDCDGAFVDISQDGQTSVAPWSSGWTAMFSLGAFPSNFTNSILIGATAVNANPANPNVVAAILAYGTGSTPTFTNCVLDPGIYGYTINGNGTANRPTDGGGNRSLANEALGADDFG